MKLFNRIRNIFYNTYFETKPIDMNDRLVLTCLVFGFLVVAQFVIFIILSEPMIMFSSAVFTLIFFFCIVHTVSKKSFNLSIRLLYYSGVLLACFCDFILGWRYLYSLYAIVILPVMFYVLDLSYLGSPGSQEKIFYDDGELDEFTADGSEEDPVRKPRRSRSYQKKRRRMTVESIITAFFNIGVNLLFHHLSFTIERETPFATNEKAIYWVSGFNIILCTLLLIHFSALFIADVRRYQYLFERKTYELERFALYDPLMGVRNRQSISEDIDRMMKEAEENKTPLTIALADIDNFKNINDRYGHAQGDRILSRLGSIFAELVPENCIVCRWGGEEMLFVIPEDLEESKKLFIEIRHKLSTLEFRSDSEPYTITLTFGVETFSEGVTFDEMIQHADDYLYMGKQNGRDCIVYQNFYWRY